MKWFIAILGIAALIACSKTEKVTNTEIRTEVDTLFVTHTDTVTITQMDTVVIRDTVYIYPSPDTISGIFRYSSNCFYYLQTTNGNIETIVWDAAPADVDPYLNRSITILGGYDGRVIRCYPILYCTFAGIHLN